MSAVVCLSKWLQCIFISIKSHHEQISLQVIESLLFTVSCRKLNEISTASVRITRFLQDFHVVQYFSGFIMSRQYLEHNTWPLLFLVPYPGMLFGKWQMATHWKIQIDNVCVNMHQGMTLKDMYCSYNIGQRRKWLHLAVYFCSHFVSFNMPEWAFVFRDIRDWERSFQLGPRPTVIPWENDCLFVNTRKLSRDERKLRFAFHWVAV